MQTLTSVKGHRSFSEVSEIVQKRDRVCVFKIRSIWITLENKVIALQDCLVIQWP